MMIARTKRLRQPRVRSRNGVCALATLAMCALLFAGCRNAPNADVLATVNGHAIPRSEVDRMYTAQLGDAQAQAPSHDQSSAMRLQALRELIDEEIVEQRAAKMNLTATNDEVDAKLAEMKAPYTEEQFAQRLKASNHTLDEVKHDLRRSLTIEKLLNKEINSKITVSDADISGYYAAHKAEYNLIEPVYRLAQIQVTSLPSAQPGNLQGSKANNDAEAKKKIQAIKLRLDSGEDFGEMAANFSERPETASNGGDMGFVTESQMRSDPAVSAAITGLKAGAGHGYPAGAGRTDEEACGVRNLQARRAGAGGAARPERSRGAAGDPAAAARRALATLEECIPGDAARSGAGGKLSGGADFQE